MIKIFEFGFQVLDALVNIGLSVLPNLDVHAKVTKGPKKTPMCCPNASISLNLAVWSYIFSEVKDRKPGRAHSC